MVGGGNETTSSSWLVDVQQDMNGGIDKFEANSKGGINDASV